MKNNLKGTEKQVKWAEDIREKMIADFEHLKKEGEILKVWNTLPLNPKELSEEEITKSYEELISSQEDAKWFIENKQTWIIELVHEKELLNYVKEIAFEERYLQVIAKYLETK